MVKCPRGHTHKYKRSQVFLYLAVDSVLVVGKIYVNVKIEKVNIKISLEYSKAYNEGCAWTKSKDEVPWN